MSHTTSLKSVAIRDVAAIRAAVDELKQSGVNINLLENAKPRMFYENQHGNCAFVLQLPDSRFDIGLDAQADGTYAPVFDEWQGYIGKQVGATCPMPNTPEGKAQHQIGRFLQGYAKHAAINAATSQGYMVEGTSTDEHGNVHLTLTGM
jgi:hypothetical protein